MGYKSNRTAIDYVLKEAKHDFCVGIGTLLKAEAKRLCPVLTGNLRRNIDCDVIPGDKGAIVGEKAQSGKGKFTRDTSYGLYVEKGIGQPAQPYLEPGAMNAIPKIPAVARSIYRKRVGDK